MDIEVKEIATEREFEITFQVNEVTLRRIAGVFNKYLRNADVGSLDLTWVAAVKLINYELTKPLQ